MKSQAMTTLYDLECSQMNQKLTNMEDNHCGKDVTALLGSENGIMAA